jgi:6-phosphogluconolactonase
MGSLAFIGGYGSGISVYARHGAHLNPLATVPAPDPSYLVADPRRRVLYAVNEADPGSVTAYAVAPDGALRPLATQPTGGAHPCHLALAGDHLIAANYGTGSVSVHPVAPSGALRPATSLVRHRGHGPDPERQRGPHAHQITADGDRITVVDLGRDRLVHYRLHPGTGRLAPDGETVAAAGSGPRHGVVHSSGRWYVAGELDSTVTVFAPGGGGSPLRRTATHPATVSTSDTRNFPAGIALSGDGRWLYVSNRGADTIATFATTTGGGLERVAETGTGGHWPRHFAACHDPESGTMLFVANERSGTVTCLRVDPGTGVPWLAGTVAEPGRPACVLLTAWPAPSL